LEVYKETMKPAKRAFEPFKRIPFIKDKKNNNSEEGVGGIRII